MKIKKLKPCEVMPPGEFELGDEKMLEVYYRIIRNGGVDSIPPVLTIRTGELGRIIERLEDKEYGLGYLEKGFWVPEKEKMIEARRKDYRELLDKLTKSQYMLIDGNHRAVAATLLGKLIPSLEIENDEQLRTIEKMIERGELPEITEKQKTVEDLRMAWITYCLGYGGAYLVPAESGGEIKKLPFYNATQSMLRHTGNMQERVEQLVSQGDIPRYMIENYFGRGESKMEEEIPKFSPDVIKALDNVEEIIHALSPPAERLGQMPLKQFVEVAWKVGGIYGKAKTWEKITRNPNFSEMKSRLETIQSWIYDEADRREE